MGVIKEECQDKTLVPGGNRLFQGCGRCTVELTYLPFYPVAVHSIMEVTLGSTDEYPYTLAFIGQEPHQTDGKNRNLSVSLTEQPIGQFPAA